MGRTCEALSGANIGEYKKSVNGCQVILLIFIELSQILIISLGLDLFTLLLPKERKKKHDLLIDYTSQFSLSG